MVKHDGGGLFGGSGRTANRQPWRKQTRAESDRGWAEDEPGLFARAVKGPRGDHGGWVWHPMRLPLHEETTNQLRGAFPFVAGHALTGRDGRPVNGAYVGINRTSQGPFVFDPFELYRAGVLTNPNICLSGVIGSGKSSLQKTLVLRWIPFGIKFFVPADTKGEYRTLAEKVGADRAILGPGHEHAAMNPLWAPERPKWMEEILYEELCEQHRLSLLRALGETALGRHLTPVEDTLIDLALAEVTGSLAATSSDRRRVADMQRFVAAMLEPTEEMARSVPIPLTVLQDEGRAIALRFRSMLRGALKGVFDGETVKMNPASPGMVIDISGVRASEAAMALTMTCGQALGDLMLSFDRNPWVKILDECWRLIRYPAIVRRISEGQKLARGDERTAGSSTLIAVHRISDLLGSSPEVRDLGMGLLADTGTRIVYRQATDQIEATRQALALTDVEAEHLPGLQQGAGLWKVDTQQGAGRYSAIVDHLVLPDGLEWDLINTDSRMKAQPDEPGPDYNSVHDPVDAMDRELSGVQV